MRTYYAVVNVGDRRLETHVSAENIAVAFEAATFKYKTQRPKANFKMRGCRKLRWF
jgi:hypothetical protein